MKRGIVNFIAVLGLVLLGAALILGLLTGLLFIFPKMSILGAKAVNERDTQIVYRDAALVEAFANGKFILESSGADIEVKMSNKGYDGQNTIVVNESATGIAFNNLNRTLIEWTQTLYGEDDELYYRIKILEPSGMIFNQKTTTVYINLPYRGDNFHYDFVLQNHYSAVNFSFVDDTADTNDSLLIDNLIVESAAKVNFPYNTNNSINNVTIKGNNTNLICKSPVLGKVTVTGANNALEFGNDSLAGIAGNLTIQGNNNKFSGSSAGNVDFTANNGSLNLSGTISSLNVETVRAPITVNNVTGAVIMTTQYGNLQAASIGGGLNFAAGTVEAPYATASINVGKVTGSVAVNNYGLGSVTLSDVNGNVTVNSFQIGGGAIDVSFSEDASNRNVNILGYDGNIHVNNINGGNVNIKVLGERLRAGAANIYAQFNKVGTAEIRTGGYISGVLDWGNVEIKLANDCNDVDLYVYYARSANSIAKYGYNDNNMFISDDNTERANHITINGGGTADGTLKVYSQNTVYLS